MLRNCVPMFLVLKIKFVLPHEMAMMKMYASFAHWMDALVCISVCSLMYGTACACIFARIHIRIYVKVCMSVCIWLFTMCFINFTRALIRYKSYIIGKMT